MEDGIGYGEVITRREPRAIAFACDVVIGHREAEAGGDGPAAGSHLHHPSFGDLDVLASTVMVTSDGERGH
jgi:hypothetical protein